MIGEYSEFFGENLDTSALITLSSQGAGIITSADQANQNFKGLILGINLTTMTTASVVVQVRGKDAASGDYYPIFTSPALTTTGLTPLTVYPGVADTTGAFASPLPATWDIQVTVTGGSAVVTGTIGASLLQ